MAAARRSFKSLITDVLSSTPADRYSVSNITALPAYYRHFEAEHGAASSKGPKRYVLAHSPSHESKPICAHQDECQDSRLLTTTEVSAAATMRRPDIDCVAVL